MEHIWVATDGGKQSMVERFPMRTVKIAGEQEIRPSGTLMKRPTDDGLLSGKLAQPTKLRKNGPRNRSA